MGSGYPKGGGPGKVTARNPRPRARRIKNLPHDGLRVTRKTLRKCDCAGSGPDESPKELEGYEIMEGARGFDDYLTVCRACAMKLAMRIFELENL